MEVCRGLWPGEAVWAWVRWLPPIEESAEGAEKARGPHGQIYTNAFGNADEIDKSSPKPFFKTDIEEMENVNNLGIC